MSTILWVDDEELFLKTASRYFRRKGYEVIACEKAQEALDCFSGAEGAAVDAVVLDYNLPDLSGADCLRKLLAERPGVPSVILSGYPPESFDPEEVEHADAVLYKPVELSIVEELVAGLLAELR